MTQTIQQVVFPEAVARKMFPADSKWLLPNEMPSITWLAGWVKCEQDSCYGGWVGMQPGDSTEHCEHCNGLGYPAIVEIVSYETFMAGDGENAIRCTVHGRLALGTPVAVVNEVVDSECVAIGGNGYYHLPEYRGHPSDAYDITDAVAGTLIPGGVAYPVTVVT
ncbi:hypothetical protein [Ilumatobacter sp.]|uniref:hypothetical protein n=1 Tax=Ilumatobacter sp. TaxID=1967498 RepID=UPI00375190C8